MMRDCDNNHFIGLGYKQKIKRETVHWMTSN